MWYPLEHGTKYAQAKILFLQYFSMKFNSEQTLICIHFHEKTTMDVNWLENQPIIIIIICNSIVRSEWICAKRRKKVRLVEYIRHSNYLIFALLIQVIVGDVHVQLDRINPVNNRKGLTEQLGGTLVNATAISWSHTIGFVIQYS